MVSVPSCLRVPRYLGVHSLTLGEEHSLDDGKLKIWTGAAAHDDPAADAATQLLQEQQRHRAATGGGLETRSDQVFYSTPASGTRVLGGPFLRAALRSEADDATACVLHVWLAGGSN